MDTTDNITETVDTQTRKYLKQLAQYTNQTNMYTNQPGWYSQPTTTTSGNLGTIGSSGNYILTTPQVAGSYKDLFKAPLPKRYVECPDEPRIEEDFLSKEERDSIVYIPRVGARVSFNSKNGVVRTGTVNGISVHKPFIRSVECEKGNSVFVNFAESDWYYVKEPD